MIFKYGEWRSEESWARKKCYDSSKEAYSKRRSQRRTAYGFLVNSYFNLVGRCTGKHKSTAHVYKGLPFLSKEDFFNWSLKDENYNRLIVEYSLSGFKRAKAPSIDRIIANKGYVLGNIRWIAQSQNAMLGNINRCRRKKGLKEIAHLHELKS